MILYKSLKDYTTVMEYYDSNLRSWPVQYEYLNVPTRHGNTHIIASGSIMIHRSY
jgi:hypothetical protein